ncbi:MAG: SsrA-binding protein SmpB [Acidobacteria bacterium]|nr:MAG: SsrA-binding protein SmpB [Acidobacteriota bacterium]REK11782.1 MAG: SsrA-binding protein SmpB [Acidobacteriota bacterium]
MARKKQPAGGLLAQNRKARHDYNVLQSLEAGIALVGTEVKSARAGKVQLRDSYVEFRAGEAFLVGAHISPYEQGNRENHEPTRARKLLLHRREIENLYGRSQVKGKTVVPLSMYLSGNRIKLEIALVQGKTEYDKRESERRKELDREVEEALHSRDW